MLTVAPPARIMAKRKQTAEARIAVTVAPGYHVNSHTPSEEYLIPLRLTWNAGPLETADVVYPKPGTEKYSFSAKPLSVFTGKFDLLAKFKVPASAPPGPGVLIGKLRYQACNDNSCFPPKTVEVRLPYVIE